MEEDLLSEEDATASGRVWRRTCSKRRAASDDLRAWMVEDLLLVNYIAAHGEYDGAGAAADPRVAWPRRGNGGARLMGIIGYPPVSKPDIASIA
uniref:Uncharacterized protein n=1 Tax=Oryza sativa subsp. japonica TaxID=39947 RepID=Q67VB4_ORYSJ|nr:hypothetical protein [Oryza sativa Japonica Group]BAD37905.1 hypothetical protein [Oryza sativa Japonica Group]